jgi:hypothetical protein
MLSGALGPAQWLPRPRRENPCRHGPTAHAQAAVSREGTRDYRCNPRSRGSHGPLKPLSRRSQGGNTICIKLNSAKPQGRANFMDRALEEFAMYRSSVAKPHAGKSRPGTYCVGQFLITRVGSRWRIRARHFAPNEEFSTLGGALAWCRQQRCDAIARNKPATYPAERQ